MVHYLSTSSSHLPPATEEIWWVIFLITIFALIALCALCCLCFVCCLFICPAIKGKGWQKEKGDVDFKENGT